ncbi:hypothetical protein [uncultured Tateyamaria sp.]|uniref:hypothetical protein n=1 Tax=uncultured Tateyamaria sp. TaxID=455651 RepID=UPI002614C2D4|nr:hypothetical protein [uncultured Tateyamaria sp.]
MVQKPKPAKNDISAGSADADDTQPQDSSQFGADHRQEALNTLNAQADASKSAGSVNAQIEAIVVLLNKKIAKSPGELARVGLELATSQSLSIAVQDSVDHLRLMQVLVEATLARAVMPEASKEDAVVASATQTGVDTALQPLQRVADLAQAV